MTPGELDILNGEAANDLAAIGIAPRFADHRRFAPTAPEFDPHYRPEPAQTR